MLYINKDIVWKSPVLQIGYAGSVIRQLFEDKKNGTACAAQEVPLFPNGVRGGFYSLPSSLDRYGVAGIKWTTHVKPADGSWEKNGSYTKPVLILSDYHDGRPLALIDGLEISAIRTGAVSHTFFEKYRSDGCCGKKNRLLICGAGHQAKWQVLAALEAFPKLEALYIWSRDINHAAQCVERVREVLTKTGSDVSCADKLIVVRHFEEALDDVDLVIGAASAETPYLTADHLKNASYVHIGMNDVEGDAIRTYETIYCDDFEAGTKKSAQSLFVLYRQDPSIAGRVTLLENAPDHIDGDRVMFDSFGLSIFDIGLGCEVYRFAKENGLGEEIALYSGQY